MKPTNKRLIIFFLMFLLSCPLSLAIAKIPSPQQFSMYAYILHLWKLAGIIIVIGFPSFMFMKTFMDRKYLDDVSIDYLAEKIPCSFFIGDGSDTKKITIPYDHCRKIAITIKHEILESL